MEKDLEFIECKGDVVINLEAIELNLLQCSDIELLLRCRFLIAQDIHIVPSYFPGLDLY